MPRYPGFAAIGWFLLTLSAWAGGGPENVAVVVNDDSFASQAVANAFVELREIPAVNVVHLALGDLPDFETIDVETFRDRLLKPTLETLDQRGREIVKSLSQQIDRYLPNGFRLLALDLNPVDDSLYRAAVDLGLVFCDNMRLIRRAYRSALPALAADRRHGM